MHWNIQYLTNTDTCGGLMLTKQELKIRLQKLESMVLDEPIRALCVLQDGSEIVVSVDEMIQLGDGADFRRIVSGSSLSDLDKILTIKIGGTII